MMIYMALMAHVLSHINPVLIAPNMQLPEHETVTVYGYSAGARLWENINKDVL